MKKGIFIFLMAIGSISFSQPVVDGFLKGKNNLDLAPSLTYENFSQYYASMNETTPISRTSIAANIYAAYGITKYLDVQVSAPYIYTAEDFSNFQDFSIYLKGALVDKSSEAGNNFKLMLAGGFKTPMTNYKTQGLNAIGQADTAFDGRIVAQTFRTNGFFIMAQGGYVHRIGVTPSSVNAALKIGWAKEKYYLDIWYDHQMADGGNDYADHQAWVRLPDAERDTTPQPSFRSFGVSYGKIGASYYRPLGKHNGFSVGAFFVLWGRNIGQAYGVSAAYVHRFNFSKE